MMKKTGSGISDSRFRTRNQVDGYIRNVNRKGTLDPSAKVFVALALNKSIKGIGCSLHELCLLTRLKKQEVKRSLAQLEAHRLLKLGERKYAVPTSFMGSRIHLPSFLVKGRGAERRSGPCVPLYELEFVDREIVIQTLTLVTEFTTEDFIGIVENQIRTASNEKWTQYVTFARILIQDVRSILMQVKRMLGDFVPYELEEAFAKLFDAISAIDGHCDDRDYTLSIMGQLKIRLLSPISAYWRRG